MEKRKKLPFGMWPSPISPLMGSHRIRLNEVQWESDGETLVCLEGRSGRGVLVAYRTDDAARELAPENSVRGGLGYGGGEFTVSNGVVIFADRDRRLYRRTLEYGLPRPITPPFGAAASPVLSPDGKWVAYTYTDGSTDLIGLVDAEGKGWPRQMVRGADFYMQPAWHPDGKYLAWIEWDHPNMPWDGTRLVLGELEGEILQVVKQTQIAGGEQIPVSQPEFSPDGRWLSYIEFSGEWDQLVLLDLQTGTKKVLVEGDGFMISLPAWVQGMRFHGWSHTSESIYYLRNQKGVYSLWQVELDSGVSTQILTEPYTVLSQLTVSPVREEVAFRASSPSIPDRIVRWDGKQLHTVTRSDSEVLSPDYFSSPEPISWEAPDGTTVYGLYYPPQHPEYSADGPPPVIVHIHGGPTSQRDADFSYERAYFTTRGYGFFELNFRGSTGYGRSYQLAQRERWGEVDVEDAAGAAHALIEQGLADPKKLIIRGGSSGGYTVLNTLIHYPGLYKAGICLYGVANLFSIAMETIKFEKSYNDGLLGALPEAARRYHEWSPIYHVDRIRDPLAIFQGADDPVVSKEQSEEMVAALRRHGVPHIYRLYEGEGHGFRKNETLSDYLQQVEKFLQQFVLFAP